MEALGRLGDDVNLVELLYDDEDALAELLGEQRQFDVALILVAVADDERVALALLGDNGVELGLGAGLETEVELTAMGNHLVNDGLHLIDLDGIDDVALALVVVLLARLVVAFGHLLDAVVEDVGETEQYGGGDVAQGEFVHQFAQVDVYVVLGGRDIDIALLIDTKIGGAPAFDVVEFG